MIRRKISRKTPGYLRISLWMVLIAIIIGLVILVKFYKAVFGPSVLADDSTMSILYIQEGSQYEEVVEDLEKLKIIKSKNDFEWTAKKKNYPNHVKPGRYKLSNGMSNNELVNMLRSGKQDPVMVGFNNIRTLNELSDQVAKILEPDAEEFKKYLNLKSVAEKFGFTSESFPAMFLPNSYEFYWNTNPEEFAERMKREYVAFWSDKRIKQAEKLGLNPVEVISLASIVDQEALFDDENSRIAGVFINRIKKKIPLQSDPTIIFAKKDFTIQRVTNADRKIDSPYNTYKYRGIPPGPISIPSIAAIDAVLNFEQHNYYYFCAKPDFSGYHNFARTLNQHNKNARLWQAELDRRKIYR